MTAQRTLDALAPSIERLAPFFREGTDSPIERLSQFFQAPEGSIPPGAIQEAFSRPLGHAWGLGANAEHATDWAWELAQAGLDILLALFERAGASRGERAAAHGQWWQTGIHEVLSHSPHAPCDAEALADWLLEKLSPGQFAQAARGVAPMHLSALCPLVDLPPEEAMFFGAQGEWHLPKRHWRPMATSFEREAHERSIHWAIIARAMAADPKIALPQPMLDAGRAAAQRLNPERMLAASAWDDAVGRARAGAARSLIEGSCVGASPGRAPRL